MNNLALHRPRSLIAMLLGFSEIVSGARTASKNYFLCRTI